MSNKAAVCRVVEYTLSLQDADAINRRRAGANRSMAAHREADNGAQVHVGNNASAGDVFPMVITRVFGDTPESAVNGQVFLDGNDVLWVTSVCLGTGERTFAWPVRT